jgi:hypothetical protein
VLANRAHDGTLAPLVFEIVPEDDAPEVSYRVIVSQHDGDPFSEGESVADLRSAAPVVPAPDLRLAPGPYTWEAWSVRNGIPILLGTREFEVVADDVVLDQLEGGGRHVSPAERAEWLLHYLHEHGFLTDARTVAKEQPESPARDTYLRGFLAR